MGKRPFIVVSGSMEPSIHVGSISIIDTNANYEDIKTQDVIAFESEGGKMVTHRVINITEEGFETKGDNNDVSDGVTTTKVNYKGKNIFSIPYLGYIVRFIQTVKGRILAITGIIAIVILDLLTSEEKKQKVENA